MTEPEQQPAALVENMLLLRREDFDELLDRAAERGTERCLAHLGLENGSAAKDIRELRDLLEAWRDARRTAWQTTVKVVTQYVDRVRVVREKGETIIKEVPVYVPVQADAACTINRGFVRLHDAAAAGELPEPARDADAASAGIALSVVAGTVAANYQTCHENAEQLRALQEWVGEMTGGTK